MAAHPLTGPAPAADAETEVDCEAIDALEQAMARPAFFRAFERARYHPLEEASPDVDALTDSSWEHASAAAEEPAAVPLGENPDFVLVGRNDAIEAMAYYIAQCLAKHPEAQTMSPKQLQDALQDAFKALKQSRFKRMCAVGRSVYRWTTLSYSALQMYQNPWLVQAMIAAIWTFSRMTIRAIIP